MSVIIITMLKRTEGFDQNIASKSTNLKKKKLKKLISE